MSTPSLRAQILEAAAAALEGLADPEGTLVQVVRGRLAPLDDLQLPLAAVWIEGESIDPVAGGGGRGPRIVRRDVELVCMLVAEGDDAEAVVDQLATEVEQRLSGSAAIAAAREVNLSSVTLEAYPISEDVPAPMAEAVLRFTATAEGVAGASAQHLHR